MAQNSHLRCRALVVGGGPAGSQAARFLAASGIDTVLLERDFNHVKPCGGGIPSGAFTEIDIPPYLIEKKISKVRLYSPSGRTVEVRFRDGFIAIVNRPRFDSALRQEAARAGAMLVEGGFLRFADAGRTMTSEVLSSDKRILIKSDYVIAADGVNSRVRASMGMKPQRHIYTLTGKSAPAELDACEFWLASSHAPGFYSWAFPHPEGISAGTGCATPQKAGVLLEEFKLRRRLADIAPARGYKIPVWEKTPLVRDRVLFAGDAAGHVMPLTFEGIYYAMRSAIFAAEAIVKDKPADYGRMWGKRFQMRFSLAKSLWMRFLKDDESMERFVSVCEMQPVQDVCSRLWLHKGSDKGGLVSFLNVFRKFLP